MTTRHKRMARGSGRGHFGGGTTNRARGGPESAPEPIPGVEAVTVPARQSAREAAFTAAVRAGRSDVAATIARADVPDDATDAERARWATRRRLYR